MAYETLELLIDGEWRKGEGGAEDVLNPATEQVLGQVPHASAAELDMALAASAKGFETWRATPPLKRQAVMEKAARILEDRAEEIARNLTMEMGKPVAESKLELGFAIDVLRWYGEEGKRAYGRLVPPRIPGARQMVTKEPVGPACAFVAWNFPAVNVMRKVAGALGAGCSIIIKPSEETPATAVAIGRALQEAGLPAGVLNIVFGVPDTVSRHILASEIPKKLSFTGSVPVGKHLQKLAADTLKRCTMELGGHAPVIVFDDADLEKTLESIGRNKFRNAGQVCIAPTRFFVQDNVYTKFVEGFTELAESIKLGDGLEEGTQMGPLIAARRLDVMDEFVSDARERAGDHGGRARRQPRPFLGADDPERRARRGAHHVRGALRPGRPGAVLQEHGRGGGAVEPPELRPRLLCLHLGRRQGEADERGARDRPGRGQPPRRLDAGDPLRRRQRVRLRLGGRHRGAGRLPAHQVRHRAGRLSGPAAQRPGVTRRAVQSALCGRRKAKSQPSSACSTCSACSRS